MSNTLISNCVCCGENILPLKRKDLGYHTCLHCGEKQARAKKFTIVPMHKSNYVPVFSPEILLGVNNKGGLVK